MARQFDLHPEPLSCAQIRGLAALITFIEVKGYPPTGEELAAELGYRKKQSGTYMLDVLARKHYVERDPSTSRGLRVRFDVEGKPVRFGIIRQAVVA